MTNVKEQSAALKSRQTKLLKKSKEELIEIVLRKDKIEKNQVNQISNLKGEINSLQSRIKGFEADNEGAKSIEIEELTTKFTKIIVEKESKAKSWANIAITLGVAFVITFIAYICK